MSTFEVLVKPVTISPHTNADNLEIAEVYGYRSIVLKGQYKDGDLVAYIPEDAVVPENVLRSMGLHGKLAGSARNRVKAIRLRGVLSQGICHPVQPEWAEDQDVTELLGVTKYCPPIPTCLNGDVWNAGGRRCLRYGIENFKKYHKEFVDGETVIVTEKLHGTFAQFGVMPKELEHPEYGDFIVASNGLGGQGLAFKPDSKAMMKSGYDGTGSKNLYLRAAEQLSIRDRIKSIPMFQKRIDAGTTVHVLGEIFGQGVQDLHYGKNAGLDGEIGFRVFDIKFGHPDNKWFPSANLPVWVEKMGLEPVPELYRGPYSREKMDELANRNESITGREEHISEGIVIRPAWVTRYSDKIGGRLQLKHKSDAYLLRKGGTEFS